jgi:hypothetical protein
MDNFNYQAYIKSGKIHGEKAILTESITEKKQGYDDREDESLGARKGAEKGKKQSMKARRDDSYGKFGKRDAEKKGKNKINKEEIEVKEDARTDAEQEGYKDGFDDAKDDVKDALSKMKVSELKAKIKEQILAELSLSEAEEEVDVDIDVEDEVEVEAGADDIEIERKGVKAKVEVGLSPEEEIIQDSLKAAMDSANALGNDKLADQIGNTITFFTREYVVGDRS